MKLSLIVAASENHVIGRQGDLPWRLSADLRRFKRLTMGHCLMMGRKTYESIGRPLPGRVSIVLTKGAADQQSEGPLLYAPSLDEACKLVSSTAMTHEEAFVTGGGEVYRLAFPHADRLLLTRVHTTIEGDATFPEFSQDDWRLVESERHSADDKNEFDYSFETWERITR